MFLELYLIVYLTMVHFLLVRLIPELLEILFLENLIYVEQSVPLHIGGIQLVEGLTHEVQSVEIELLDEIFQLFQLLPAFLIRLLSDDEYLLTELVGISDQIRAVLFGGLLDYSASLINMTGHFELSLHLFINILIEISVDFLFGSLDIGSINVQYSIGQNYTHFMVLAHLEDHVLLVLLDKQFIDII